MNGRLARSNVIRERQAAGSKDYGDKNRSAGDTSKLKNSAFSLLDMPEMPSQHTPQTVGSLGDRLYLDSGTLTPLLKRMELAGLVTRV